jgi:hypothetical protein
VDEKRDVVACSIRLVDACRVVDEHGGDDLVTLQLVVSALEAGLMFVGGEDVGRFCLLLIGDERPAAIGQHSGESVHPDAG